MSWDIWRAPKAGCAMAFNASTSSAAKLLMQPPQQPVLVLLRATADVYIRQGSSTVTATTSDAKIPSGGYFPICVESSADNYVAVITASGGAILYATIISTTQSLCEASDNLEAAIFGGGQTASGIGTVISSMYKYFYASDAASASGASLSSSTTGLTQLAATGDATAARFCGGQNATLAAGTGDTDTIQKYTYSSDTIATSGTLSQTRSNCTGNANSTAGYIAKGTVNGNTTASNARKVTWASDADSLAGNWTTNNGNTAGGTYTFGNSTQGYWCGGSTSTTWQREQKILYSSDTFTQNSPVLVGARASGACQQGFGNTTTGWMVGGADSAGNPIATSEKYTYASDTSASTTSLGTARSSGASTGNSTKGVICSGKADASYAVTSSVTWTLATEAEGVGGTAITATEHGSATGPSHGGLQ